MNYIHSHFFPFAEAGILPSCSFCCSTADAPCCSMSRCRHCVPHIGESSCSCGSPWADGDPVAAGWLTQKAARLTTMTTTVLVDVFYRPCSRAGCPNQLSYDGQQDGIFNLSDKSLFTYEVLFDYWDGMTVAKLSYTAHYQRLRLSHKRTARLSLLPSRPVVRYALQGFLSLLDLDYHKFGCPCCSNFPHDQITLIGDGTTLGYRKDFACTATCPRAPSTPPRDDL